MKFLLIHQYAGNKGDRAVLYSLCSMILKINSNAKIIVSTSDPKLWSGYKFYEDNNIKFIHNAWNFESIANKSIYWKLLLKIKKYTFTILRESLLILRKCPFVKLITNPDFYINAKSADYIISVGGHHFTTMLSSDLVSSINYDSMVINSFGKNLICFSQSFGPFNFRNDRNKKITNKILNNSLCYFREENAYNELISLGINNNQIKKTFESVLYLNKDIEEYIYPSKRKKQIGIAIYSTQLRKKENVVSYVNKIYSFCKYVNKKDFEVVFFPMEMKGTGPDDRRIIKEILKNTGYEKCLYIDDDLTTEEHLKKVSECQVFIGHKTHSTIFALLTGTPLIGIAYHEKTRNFMKQFSCEEFCIDDKDLSFDELKNKFDKILSVIDVIGQKEFQTSSKYADIIYNDLKNILK